MLQLQSNSSNIFYRIILNIFFLQFDVDPLFAFGRKHLWKYMGTNMLFFICMKFKNNLYLQEKVCNFKCPVINVNIVYFVENISSGQILL